MFWHYLFILSIHSGLRSLIPDGERAILGYSIATTANSLQLAAYGNSIPRCELPTATSLPLRTRLIRTRLLLHVVLPTLRRLRFTREKMCRAPRFSPVGLAVVSQASIRSAADDAAPSDPLGHSTR